MVKSIRQVALSRKHTIDKSSNKQFTALKQIFEKSLAVNKDLSQGHILNFEDLEAKKPKGYGIDASQFTTVLGKPLKTAMKKWDFLTEKHI